MSRNKSARMSKIKPHPPPPPHSKAVNSSYSNVVTTFCPPKTMLSVLWQTREHQFSSKWKRGVRGRNWITRHHFQQAPPLCEENENSSWLIAETSKFCEFSKTLFYFILFVILSKFCSERMPVPLQLIICFIVAPRLILRLRSDELIVNRIFSKSKIKMTGHR